MHYHCEVVIPPTADIEAAVASIMKPFNEQPECDEEERSSHAFWDWYVIGGRWAGTKLLAKADQEKLQAFYAWLTAEKITVSGVQCGKQTLSPESQIPVVDAKWKELFPYSPSDHAPMFDHAVAQYGRGMETSLALDICRLDAIPEDLTAERVIFACAGWDSKAKDRVGPLEAGFMLSTSIWNGCNHEKTAWDGKMLSAIQMCRENIEHCAEGYREKHTPRDEWLAVTVDYHS